MEKVGIFFGSSTGNTEAAAEKIAAAFGGNTELFNVADTPAEKMAEFTNIIIGTSTWGVGDLQDDMIGFCDDIEKVDLKGKKVALFGLGDSSSYGDTFCDGIGVVYEALQGKGCDVVGTTSTEGYEFDASRGVQGDEFMGLALDEDNQSDLTESRIESWVDVLKGQFK